MVSVSCLVWTITSVSLPCAVGTAGIVIFVLVAGMAGLVAGPAKLGDRLSAR